MLNELADAFEARSQELIDLIALENGKIKPEAAFEAQLTGAGFRYGAALVYADYGRAAEWSAGKVSVVLPPSPTTVNTASPPAYGAVT